MTTLPLPGPDGVERVPASDLTADERQLLSAYFNAVVKVLDGRDRYAALDFEGVEILGRQLPTDPDEIEDLDDAYVWDIGDFYSSEPPASGL